VLLVAAVTLDINVIELNLGFLGRIERSELDELVTSWVLIAIAFAVDQNNDGRVRKRADDLRVKQLRVVHVTMRTVQGRESVDPMLQERHPVLCGSERVKDALRDASGLLAFHTWMKTSDLKDEHLVIAENKKGRFTVAAIDFTHSMNWGESDRVVALVSRRRSS